MKLLGLRSKTCPNAYHEMSVFCMDVLDHLLSIGKILGKEIHRIPQIVGTPVLPVLDDTIKWNLQCPILIDNTLRFLSTLIALLRLPETIGPQREHGHIA